MSKLPNKMQEEYRKALDHQKYISRITKTLYYGKFPKPEGLSLPVTELAAELFSEAQRGRSLDRLHYDDASNISRNACVSPCSLVLAVLYLERLKKMNPGYLEKTAPSDLFLVSLMVSCKFLYDDGEIDEVFIDEWALSAGTSVKNLVQLEKDFLKAIDWEIFVNKLTFWKKLTEIETKLARRQGLSRGFFTYTELQKLLTVIELHTLIKNIMSVIAILIASYTAALLTLFASVLIVSHIPGTCLTPPKQFDIQTNATSICETLAVQTDVNDSLELKVKQDIKHKFNFDKNNERKAFHILKSDVFLTSTESVLEPFCNVTDPTNKVINQEGNNVEDLSWQWWTVPTMKWLSETTTLLAKLNYSKSEVFLNIYETYRKTNFFDTEGQVIKTVKNGFESQDFSKHPWYRKWSLADKNLHHYIRNVKS